MNEKYKILIVDDSEYNRSLLSDILSAEYEILEAADGMEAISIIGNRHTDKMLVLLDIVMPKMDGFEVLSLMNKRGWINEIPVIMISSETSSAYLDHAYDLGAIEYINRPFDEKTICQRIRNTILIFAKQKTLESMVVDQIMEKEESNLTMVGILSNIVEFRNSESGMHVLHIRIITELLLKSLMKQTDKYPLSASDISLIVNASSLHDVGKITIADSILNKPGKLTAEEYEIMKTHSLAGANILKSSNVDKHEKIINVGYEICRWHHERYDGKGYPDGLKGEEIPISAQVVSLADVYDALTSPRVYKEAFPHDVALEMILDGQCGTFNPILLECLKDISDTLRYELTIRSESGVSDTEIKQVTNEIMQKGGVSSRTLTLLEQERSKYHFFASMSQEIQIDYDRETDIMTISEYAAKKLGISETIISPMKNDELHKIISLKDLENIVSEIDSRTPEDPIITSDCYLKIGREMRWHKCFIKPLFSKEGSNEVTGILGKFIDNHDEHETLFKLKQLTERDALTGLLNIVTVKNHVDACAEKNKIDGVKHAFALFDIDNFKKVNDCFGHLFGDHVLTGIAKRLSAALSPSDLAARVGGDEFLVIIEYNDENISTRIDKIFKAINCKFGEVEVNISMGVSVCPFDGKDYKSLFHRADQAMYSVKQKGGNGYVFYDESMSNLLIGEWILDVDHFE